MYTTYDVKFDAKYYASIIICCIKAATDTTYCTQNKERICVKRFYDYDYYNYYCYTDNYF